jgi:hypothetical protein
MATMDPRREQLSDGCEQTTAGQRMHGVILMGLRLFVRNLDRQTGETQIRVAVRNRYTAVGILVTKATG